MREIIQEHKHKIIAAVILLAIMCISFPNLSNPPVELGDRWRQPDTFSMMRNLIEDNFNVFRPQLNYNGPKPSYVQLEFPIYAAISAILFTIFGESYFIPRFISLLFFALSAYYLYLLMKKYFSQAISVLAMVIYCILPISIYWSRAIIPESSMMFFLIAGYYYFVKWYEDGKGLYCSAILISLGMLTKPQVGFVGLALLVLCIKKYGLAFLKEKKLWIYAAIALLPYAAWFIYGFFTADQLFVSEIARKHILRNALIGFFSGDNLALKLGRIIDMIGFPALCAAIIGVSKVGRKFPLAIIMFALSMFIEMITIMGAINLRYYLFPFAPAVAMMAAVAFEQLYNAAKPFIKDIGFWFKSVSLAAALVLIFATSYQYAKPLFAFDHNLWMFDAVEIMEAHSEKEDVFLIAIGEPTLLSLSHRAGYRVGFGYYGPPEAELERYISMGAMYFYTHNGYIQNDHGGAYRAHLDNTYMKTDYGDGHVIYNLRVLLEGAP